jgi:transglutaminase-like putative cysteine protease
MESNVQPLDDQPISATFFGEGKWLSDFVTPAEPDILMLFKQITAGANSREEAIVACWDWVANQVQYKNFIKAQISIEGKSFYQEDFWQSPSLCSKTHVGNCANKAFLLTSLVRNILGPDQVHCVLGNLYNGHAAGHAWVEAVISGKPYILESTRNDVPMIQADTVERYEPVHYFNDHHGLVVPGRTVLTPFHACYSSWLKDYLDWSYINGGS